MSRNFSKNIFIALLAGLFFSACKYDKIEPTLEGYPEEIGKIFSTRCAVTGCHTTNDKDAAGGLDLSSWDAMFRGARNGSPVIPFRAEHSFLTNFINSYPDLGITHPAGNPMPPSGALLSHDDVAAVIDWINHGAPSNLGTIKFADDLFRKKIYVTNQGCDEVAVIDAASRQIMRYIRVGADSTPETPHQIRVSPDRKYWYVIFSNFGKYLQRYDAGDDSFIDQVFIGSGSWNTFTLTPDGKHAFVADWQLSGKVVHVNLETMTMTSQTSITMNSPHATSYMRSDSALYVSIEEESKIYRFSFRNDPTFTFNVNDPPGVIVLPAGDKPHDIIFTPDESKYFVTCAGTNMVRVYGVSQNFDVSPDSLIASIPVGTNPREFAISQTRPYLFVTCQDDISSSYLANPQDKGSIVAINYNTLANVPILSNMDLLYYEPHGIAVDDANGMVYVGSRNTNTNGPTPHHTTVCGRPGWVSIIDIRTEPLHALSFDVPLIGTYYYKHEVLSDPYSVMMR